MIFTLGTPEIKDISTIIRLARKHDGANIGLTSGCFDLLHYLHALYLERCKRHCDILVVGIDSDSLVSKTKGPNRPIFNDIRRAYMLNVIRYVDYVFIMSSMEDLLNVCSLIKPEMIFKNEAFSDREDEIVGKDHAGKIVFIKDVVEDPSTTKIISRIVASKLGEKATG